MIGTNSVAESNAEILYPSISVCSERLTPIRIGQNLSIPHPSLNLSEIVAKVILWERNDTGQLQKLTIEPKEGKLENRDKQMLLGLLITLRTYYVFLTLKLKARCPCQQIFASSKILHGHVSVHTYPTAEKANFIEVSI